MTPNQWNRNTRDSVVRLLTQAGFSEDSSVINQLECMNFDAPTEPTQPQSDGVIVPRELLERVAKPVLFTSQEDSHYDACTELRAMLGGEHE